MTVLAKAKPPHRSSGGPGPGLWGRTSAETVPTVKVHLVDGTFELFRAFYGPPGAMFEGREVGATRALAGSLLSLAQSKDVTHVAVAFDTVIESFRNELYDGYKTGEGIDPALKGQFELAEQAAEALGLVVWRMVDFEADDAIAAAAAKFKSDKRVDQVLLTSPDKDLCQIVEGKRVICWDRMRRKTLDEDGVQEKFGVPPRSIPDYLALVGDSADGIPGIPRWGAKGTAAVLSRYGCIEEIPSSADDWDVKVRGAAGLAENLAAQREDALLFKKLATLRTDVPLEEDLDDLAWQGADDKKIDALLRVTGDDELKGRIKK
jgi:5'-3' exonuclease